MVSIIATGTHNCHVNLLDFYFSKVSPKLVAADSKFYLFPLPFVPAVPRPCYFDSVLPPRTLQTLLKKMCEEAKFVGNFTNHSLRATGATTLFDAGVPEAIIQKRTGHKSIDALCCYERVTPSQELAVSQILGAIRQPTNPTSTIMDDNEDCNFLDNLPS